MEGDHGKSGNINREVGQHEKKEKNDEGRPSSKTHTAPTEKKIAYNLAAPFCDVLPLALNCSDFSESRRANIISCRHPNRHLILESNHFFERELPILQIITPDISCLGV